MAFDHLEFIEKIRTESVAGVYPVNSVNGSLGVGITYVNYGSIEIFIQDKIVTQITVRNIRKTSVVIDTEKKPSNKSVRVDFRS